MGAPASDGTGRAVYPRPLLIAAATSFGIASDTDRKNFTPNTESGPVTAGIWIRHNGSTKSRRVFLDLFSGNGFVRAIVVRLSLGSSDET